MSEHTDTDDERIETDRIETTPERGTTPFGGFGRRDFLRSSAAMGVAGAAGSGLFSGMGAAQSTGSDWQKAEPRLKTPWFDDVSPDNAHPEYPRPQLVREDWESLNGLWGHRSVEDLDLTSPPTGETLDEEILVPYPVESALSGIKRRTDEDLMWYRRTFSVPSEWGISSGGGRRGKGHDSNRLLVHFEAVDFEATVFLNGEKLGDHEGGYDSFTFDVTDALEETGDQELVVGVSDPTDDGGQPLGKQRDDPGGIFYTASSGIWQSVWMEPVPEASIDRLDMTPDLSADALDLTVETNNADGYTVEATAYDDGTEVGSVSGSPGEELTLPVPDPHLWTPDDPFLYDLEVRLLEATHGHGGGHGHHDAETAATQSVSNHYGHGHDSGHEHGHGGGHGRGHHGGHGHDGGHGHGHGRGGHGHGHGGHGHGHGHEGTEVDTVESYFGMRSVGTREINGTRRPTLNGEFVFQMATLDQGFWPDGIYTPPTDEALRFDLEKHKEMGFNTVRKHIKVENNRWFYHADKLGLMVWQDMSAPRTNGPPDHNEYQKELHQLIREHGNHPSIVQWVPFNEGWGRFDITRITSLVKELDPSRLVDGMSGTNVCGCDPGNGDVLDWHIYTGPGAPPESDDRASVLGEYGGLGLAVEDHLWTGDQFSYQGYPNAGALMDDYVQKVHQLESLMEACGLSAAVYTQLSDVEGEINGLFTYDRQVWKPQEAGDVDRMREAQQSLIERSKNLEANPVEPDEGTPGLDGVGYWPFDQDSGTTAPDAADGHDGTLVNGPTWTAGHTGNALHFDGNDDYVDTGASILDVTTDFSVAAWVKLDDTNGFKTAVSQNRDGTSAFFLQYSADDDQLAFSTANTRALANEAPETGQWYHVVGVMEHYDGLQKLYIDGEQVASVRNCIGVPADGNTVIGRANFGGDEVDFWSGALDEVHVYEKPLTADEVGDLYESGQ